MTASERYRVLTERLLESETWGNLSEVQDEAIREEMDSLWWTMTEEERATADAWLAAERSKAPEDLQLVELPGLEVGSLHRSGRAA